MAMTTSVTRSRRAEGIHLPNPKIANAHRLLANAKDHYAPRPKRQLDASDREFDPVVAKKARFTTGIAVEIPARSSYHARFAKETTDADAKPAPRAPKPAIAAPNNPPTSHRAPPAKGPKPAPARTQQQQQQQQQPTLTKHQEKVANGLKHELDRLQPNAADTKEQGRKLRSQEATRFKSELSAYFPEYDEVIGNDPKETHLLNLDTPIIITDVSPASPPNNLKSDSSSSHPLHPAEPTTTIATTSTTTYPIRSYSDALFTDLFDAQRIDFSFLNKNNKQQPPFSTDPLPDTLFSHPHKKAERLERSIRNTEKGRAQHEKDQIIRLLDGLQGPDWLRVMGVSGITETKKRAFEPAREHFIRGCEGILEKFRRWAAEEKRRRLELAEKRALANEEGGSSVDGEGSQAGDERRREVGESDADDESQDGNEEGEGPDDLEGEPPDDSDVDASVAKQLREEALAAAAKKKNKSAAAKTAAARRAATTRGKAAAAPAAAAAARRPSREPTEEREPPREFTSFFAKRYQREAALSKNRRRGRKVLAWGQPVPDLAEAEFELPAELRDEETLRTHARKKRRDKRVRK